MDSTKQCADRPPSTQPRAESCMARLRVCGVEQNNSPHTKTKLIFQIRVLCVVIYHAPLRDDDAFVLEAEVLTVLQFIVSPRE